MTSKIVRPLAVVLILSLLTFGVVLAKGAPSKVTISGPGLVGEVEVADPDLLEAFSFFQFENIYRKIETPLEPGEGYVVTRYVQDGTTLRAWDRAIYYPSPAGELGVVFLEGLIGPSASEFDGYWYWASRDGDAVMQQILAEHVATPAQETPGTTLLPMTPMATFALSLLALLALVGVIVRLRRALRQAE